MDSKLLERNFHAFMVQLWFMAIGGFIVAVIIGIMVGAFFTLLLGSADWSGFLTFLIILFMIGFAAMIYYIKWQSIEYLLGPEAILVTTSVGAVGKKQKVYLYESIISASFNQNIFGRKYGYGDMHITIPKLDQKLILKDVDRPGAQLPFLQDRIKQKVGIHHNTLVT